MSEEVPIDKLAAIYIKIRTKISELTKKYDTEVEVLKEQQEQIKFALNDKMKELGVESMRTSAGTVSRSVKTRFNTQDWDSFKAFLVEHDVLDLLEKRIAQGNMAKFLEDNPGLVPPGLNSTTEYDISVRKPT
jgi:hypothetical protein